MYMYVYMYLYKYVYTHMIAHVSVYVYVSAFAYAYACRLIYTKPHKAMIVQRQNISFLLKIFLAYQLFCY